MINNDFWAIKIDALDGLQRVAQSFLQNPTEKISFFGLSEDRQNPKYKINNSTAIIQVHGPIAKRPGLFSFFDSTNYEQLSRQFIEAEQDNEVKAIVLDIDSPGGVVSGTDEFTNLVASSKKPVVAYSSGLMCSAAFWVGAAASKIIISKTAELGSIGVMQWHYDESKMDSDIGVERTVLTAGEFKAVGHSAAPLSDRDRGVMQGELQYLYDVFIDAIAKNRGVSTESVQKNMADGRVFIGVQAVEAGLADQIGTFEDAIASALNTNNINPEKNNESIIKEDVMPDITTVEALQAAYPDLIKQVITEATNQATASAGKEITRVMALVGAHFGPEETKKLEQVVEMGLTAEQYQAFKDLAPKAETSPNKQPAAGQPIDPKHAEMLKALQENASAQNPGADPAAAQPAAGQDFMNLVKTHMTANKVGYNEAFKEVIKTSPKAHAEYLKQVNKK